MRRAHRAAAKRRASLPGQRSTSSKAASTPRSSTSRPMAGEYKRLRIGDRQPRVRPPARCDLHTTASAAGKESNPVGQSRPTKRRPRSPADPGWGHIRLHPFRSDMASASLPLSSVFVRPRLARSRSRGSISVTLSRPSVRSSDAAVLGDPAQRFVVRRETFVSHSVCMVR